MPREVDGDHIRCAVCGNWFKALGTHVTRVHGYASANAYRQDFGLSQRGLVGNSTYQKHKRHAADVRLTDLGEPTRVTGPRPEPKISPEGRAVGNANLNKGYLPGLQSKHEQRRAATHCINGHPYDEQNTATTTKGYRRCRQCSREQKAKERQNSQSVRP
jgi:hypothetical protein